MICGIDPGLATGGLVLVELGDVERVRASVSLVEKRGAVAEAKRQAKDLAAGLGGWSDIEFLAAALRTESWCGRLAETLDALEDEHGTIDVYAVETFVDQPSRAKKVVRSRWMTPLVIGRLTALLAERGVTPANGGVVYQNAGVVIQQSQKELALLESRGRDKRDVLVEGDHLVSNDHERKALMHALALSLRIKRHGLTKARPQPLTTTTV